jgi:hypothetical protein
MDVGIPGTTFVREPSDAEFVVVSGKGANTDSRTAGPFVCGELNGMARLVERLVRWWGG